jgi:AcrR family transcriptional regulator
VTSDAQEVPAPPWRTSPKQAAGRQPLSQRSIVETALAIMDREGLSALSMRRVAQELGTGAASLYVYVANKDELLELVLDLVIGEARLPEVPEPERWEEQVKEIMREARRVFLAHPDVARVSLATIIPTGVNALINAERTLAVLRGGGLPDQVAAHAVDLLSKYVEADAVEASFHLEKRPGQAEENLAEHFTQVRDYFSALPPNRFPNIVAMVPALMAGDGEERFEFGLDILVRGLAAYAVKPSGGNQP